MSKVNARAVCGALDEKDGRIILRGRLDHNTFEGLLVDDYQREILPDPIINRIVEGFRGGSEIPDIKLGMRGDSTRSRGDSYTLLDPVYIVDGLQRVTAARRFILKGGTPRLGATVYFDTDRDWESKMFWIWHKGQIMLHANIHLRNMRHESSMVATLISMCEDDPQFVMKGRVSWKQGRYNCFINACTLLRTVGTLHDHVYPFAGQNVRIQTPFAQKIYDEVGRNTFRANVRTFFQLIDDCWDIRNVAFVSEAHYLRATFLITLANVLCEHERFWQGNRLSIEKSLANKLKSFPVRDPEVKSVSGKGAKLDEWLFNKIVAHLDKGKQRTNRLKRRQPKDE